MLVPAFGEMVEAVAFDYRFWASALVVGADAEGFQQVGQLFWFHGFVFVPFIPGTVVHGVEIR
jgi:hypothetical protein